MACTLESTAVVSGDSDGGNGNRRDSNSSDNGVLTRTVTNNHGNTVIVNNDIGHGDDSDSNGVIVDEGEVITGMEVRGEIKGEGLRVGHLSVNDDGDYNDDGDDGGGRGNSKG